MKRLASRNALSSLKSFRKARQSTEFLSLFDRILNACAEYGRWGLGQEAVNEGIAAWNDGLFATDELFLLLCHTSAYHKAEGEHDKVADLYIQAANRFADFNAFQSAYRILADAEEYAREFCPIETVLRVLENCATISLMEGDLAFTEKIFRKIRRTRKVLGLKVPVTLSLNLGNLQLRRGRYSDALSTFAQGKSPDHPRSIRLACFLNSSICLRELGKVQKSQRLLAEARALLDDDTGQQTRIELELVEAKTTCAAGEYMRAIDCLVMAIRLIDADLEGTGRLHYRRGVREQYRDRISHILCALPTTGKSDLILPILSFLKSNSTSDWMALLDWHERVLADTAIPDTLTARLEEAIQQLALSGAPVLYGFREKYDEPWSSGRSVNEDDFSSASFAPQLPWGQLNNVIREISAYTEDGGPWQAASSLYRARELKRMLRGNDCFMAVAISSTAASIYVVLQDTYSRVDLSIDEITSLELTFACVKGKTEAPREFRIQLQTMVDHLSAVLKPLLDNIATSEARRIVILPDAMLVPISASLIAHPGLRERMKSGNLALIVCPAPNLQKDALPDLNSIAGCKFDVDQLPLDGPELDLIKLLLAPRHFTNLVVTDETVLQEAFNSSVVHFAAHGAPISNLRDAFFSSDRKTGYKFNVPDLQANSWKTAHRLVVLNTCFSADIINWNVMRNFTTNEQVSVPTTLLLNRRSAVIASTWALLDSAAYIFSKLFYSELKTGASPAVAFARASATMYEMESGTAREILNTIVDAPIRDGKLRLLPESGKPFQHAYISGTYQFLSLL
jgi:tetratricopeptide (TPR) repeat protein